MKVLTISRICRISPVLVFFVICGQVRRVDTRATHIYSDYLAVILKFSREITQNCRFGGSIAVFSKTLSQRAEKSCRKHQCTVYMESKWIVTLRFRQLSGTSDRVSDYGTWQELVNKSLCAYFLVTLAICLPYY